MNKKIYKVFSVAAMALCGIACTSNFEEINKNPYGVSDDEMQRDGYIIRASLTGIANGVISPDVNTTQFTECLLGGTQGGYMLTPMPLRQYHFQLQPDRQLDQCIHEE